MSTDTQARRRPTGPDQRSPRPDPRPHPAHHLEETAVERHRFDPVSFVFGLVFAMIAVVALSDMVVLTWIDIRWIAPSLLVLLGLALVLSAGIGRRPDAGPDAPQTRSAEADPTAVEAEAADAAGTDPAGTDPAGTDPAGDGATQG